MITATMPVTEAYNILDDLQVQGKLERAVRAGVVHPVHKEYYHLYVAVERELKSRRSGTVSIAVVDVAFRMKVSQRKVWRAINMMKG